jgi:DNA processing protein
VGNGLDTIYPSENKYLSEEIIKNNGLILSEYVIGTKPQKMNFPARNRIISGLSDGVVVIEAKKKSGTMITVDFALEQGKEVFAVPGNILSQNSEGTNELIKQGAKLISNVQDILEEFK